MFLESPCSLPFTQVSANYLSLVSFLWDIDKQYRIRSEATECAVLSGSTLFAYRKFKLEFSYVQSALIRSFLKIHF